MDNDKTEYQLWLEKAEEDEKAAKVLLREGGPPSTVCFLSQQIAEKYLKGFLIYHGVLPGKVHDLVKLSAEIEKFTPKVTNFPEALTTLSQYYIGSRYPGDFPIYSEKEAKQALEYALEIKTFVLSQIKP